MSTKAELMGCIGTAGQADCEYYCSGEGKMVDGQMQWAGFKDGPIPGGRCAKADKMVRRMDACPISGKSAKKQTKAEMWGCKTCEHAEKHTVPCCALAGKFASIANLHECPKTKPYSVEQLTKRRVEEWGQEEPPNWELTSKRREEFSGQAGQPELTEEDLAEQKLEKQNIEQFGCESCKRYRTELNGAMCDKLVAFIVDFSRCPGKEPVQQEILQETSAPPAPALPMRILAFDAATTITGWALREGDRVIEHGSIRATGHDIEARKEQIREKVLHYCLNGQPLSVVMLERSFVAGSGNTTRLLCELQGIIKNCCHRMGYPIVEPSPTTWRAICPGSGKCDKDAAVEYARLKGYVFETADEAEAICMALSFSAGLVKILDAEKEKKKNGKSKKESNGGNGSNGGKRRGIVTGTAIPTGAAAAAQ